MKYGILKEERQALHEGYKKGLETVKALVTAALKYFMVMLRLEKVGTIHKRSTVP